MKNYLFLYSIAIWDKMILYQGKLRKYIGK